MARKVSDIKDASDAPDGDQTSNLTQDTFLEFVNGIANANAKVAAANEERKKIRKSAKAAGIELGHLDAALKMADWSRNEVRDHFKVQAKYAAWLNLPVGFQPDMFKPVDSEDPKRSADDWKQAGVTAGLRGADPKPGSEVPPEHHQVWMEGWHTGQRRLADANPALNGGKAA